MINPIKTKKSVVEKNSGTVWNSFVDIIVDIICMGELPEMSDIQRIASLCFLYDSEIQNGGHLQYFENHAGKNFQETVEALKSIGADDLSEILLQAIEIWEKETRNPIQDVYECIDRANEGLYDRLDSAYYKLDNMNDYLEKLLKENQNEFIIIEED